MADLQGLFSELIRYETELWNAVDVRLRADFDLPMTRFEPMRVIERVDPCRVHDIARELVITVGGTSKLVDRIEAAGYCVRRSNPEDRRSSIIELTAEGKRVLAEASAVFQEELEVRFGEALSARELEELGAMLAKLRAKGRAI